MKLLLAGGSGQVGTILARAFHPSDEVVVVSRTPLRSTPWRSVGWDCLQNEIDDCDVVVNLAGSSVNCRYHARNRKEIIDSRVQATRRIGEAIRASAKPPALWLQMSTATIYAHRYDATNDEATGIIGGDEPGVPGTWNFSIEVAKAWEAAALEFKSPGTRQVLMRTAMVMSPDPGGVFDVLRGLVRKGLGGTNGDGRQFVSWIHETDFVRAVRFLIEKPLEGPVNLASPNPLPNAEFMRILRQACGKGFGLPAKKWMLEIGAFLLRTETELILKSRRVVPGVLLKAGFKFDQPDWAEAARELVGRRPKGY